MGKQGRRKQRQKRQQQQKQQNSRDPVNPASALHQLRHADPKIRQTALIALQATVLQQTPSASKRINAQVLEAVREQVMDANLECASAAAECLAQYLSFLDPDVTRNATATTASWTIVFITRLQQCHQTILQPQAKLKLWYALAAPIGKALCKLIEINEQALEQIMSSDAQTTAFLSTLLGLLQCVASQQPTSDSKLMEYSQEAAVYAARALHSSLDDNPGLAQHLQTQASDVDAWSNLLHSTNNQLSSLAKLHVCGSLVTLYQMHPTAWLSQILIDQVLPCLSAALTTGANPDALQTIEEEYKSAAILRKKQEEDEQLEGEIVRKIQDRKEPAKVIARRQKEIDRGSKAVINEEDTKDGQQAMEEALTAWQNMLLPLQVALEVSANLLSCFLPDEQAMDQDDIHRSPQDQSIFEAMISTNWAEGLLKVLQTFCIYDSSRQQGMDEDVEDALSCDIEEALSKSAACMNNCVLSGVLEANHFLAAWNALRPYALVTGVCSVLVVLAQQDPSFPLETGLFQQLLGSGASEEVQRDGICLLAMSLGRGSTSDVIHPATQELLRLLQGGPNLVKIEILNAMMDLWGQDDFYPEVFAQYNLLSSFQSALASLSTLKDLDTEAEEVLYNAERFVEYKKGQ